MVKKRLLLTFLILLILCVSLYSEDWPIFRGNQYLTGNNDDIKPTDAGLNWTYKTETKKIIINPVSINGKVFFTTLDGDLIALDELSGNELWKFNTKAAIIRSPVYYQGKIYLHSGDTFYCIFQHNGKTLWNRKYSYSQGFCSPIVLADKVYYGSREKIVCRNALNGNLIWTNNQFSIFGSSPVFANDIIFMNCRKAGDSLDYIVAFNADTGKIIWENTITRSYKIFTPIIHNGILFVSSVDYIFSFDIFTGRRNWQRAYNKRFVSETIFANDKLYIATQGGDIMIVDPNNSEIIGNIESGAKKNPSFAIIGDLMIINNQDAQIVAYDINEKSYKFKFQSPDFSEGGTIPSISNGRIYWPIQNYLYSISGGVLPSVIVAMDKKKLGLKIVDSETGNPLNGFISFYTRNSKMPVKKDDFEDGIYNGDINNDIIKIIVNSPQYFPAEFTDEDIQDNKIELDKIKKGQKIAFNDINFEYNKWDLTPDSMPILNSIINSLKDNPGIKVLIGGHTDNTGSPAFNQKLSEMRAFRVYQYLIKGGISSSRLEFKGYGEKIPVAPNDNEEGRANNRRTEFEIK